MFSLAQILCAIPLPLVLGLLLAFIARDLRDLPARFWQRGLGGLALVAVVVVAHAAVAATAEASLVWPRSGWHWAWWGALALLPAYALAAPAAGLGRRGSAWRWTVHGLLAAGGVVLLLLPMVQTGRFLPLLERAGGSAARWGELAGWAAAAAVLTIGGGWAVTSRRAGPLIEHIAAGLAAALMAVGIGLSGTKDIALLAGIVPLAIAGSALLHLRRSANSWDGGQLATIQLGFWYLVAALDYADLRWWGALPLALALPAGALAARVGRTPRSAAIWRLVTTVVVGLLGVAAILAWGQPETAPSDGPDYKY